MRRAAIAIPLCLALFLIGGRAPARAELPRVALRVLPFTGVTVPHQQLAGYRASLPVGVGLEVLYTPRFSLALDVSTSRHGGGPGGDGDLRLSELQVLGRWRWPRAGWTPFAQAGLGGYQAEVDEGDGKDQYGGVGLSLGGGVEIPVTGRVLVQAEVRSNWVNGEETVHNRELWIGHTQAMGWLVYRLP